MSAASLLALGRGRRPGSLVFGGAIFAAIVVLALLAPAIAPHDPLQQDLARRLAPPAWDPGGGWAHPLGTDGLGRDYLSRLIYGARISLIVGTATMLVSGAIGTTLGLLGGYCGGSVDSAVMYLVTTRLSMPGLLVALAVIALVGGSLGTIILVLGFLSWDRFVVVVRSATQQIRFADYVLASQALGAGVPRILLREILPNLLPQILVVASLEMAVAVLAEAALSFLGLGVRPPTPSWGLMIAEGRNYLFVKPYLVALPGLAIFLLVIAVNMLGDGLRDAAAPGERRS